MLDINPADVIAALESCKPQLIFFGVVAALAIIALITAAVKKDWPKPLKFMLRAQSGLAILLALVITVNLICLGPMATMISLATGSGSISETSMNAAYEYVNNIGSEGMVLLENKGGALPLGEKKLNVFGWASTNPCYGGTGSGALNDAYPTVTLLQGLTNAGLQLNTELEKFYTDYKSDRPSVGMSQQDWTLPEPNVSLYTDEMMNNAKAFSDTAIIVISRPGGENADLPTDMPAVVDGSWHASGTTYTNGVYDDTMNEGNDWDAGQHYLEINNREKELVDLVCSRFGTVVVVINTSNAIELGWMADYPAIKGAIWAPCPGQSGFSALGKILSGEVNPSGRTVDTFVADLTAIPAWNNIGELWYDNMGEFTFANYDFSTGGTNDEPPSFVNYVENIYVGYKFYETAAAEGLIDYEKEVVYPFGYGLSYTTFQQEMGPISESNGAITFDVTVTNTGSVAGKDVVEVYFNPPYTNGGIEKSAANLVEFAKTDLLEPGKSQTITITFRQEDMASFDDVGAGCYVLEAGDYVISVNSDSHTVLDSQTYTVGAAVTYGEGNGRSSDDSAAVSRFDYARGDVTYLSRRDGFANYGEATAAPASHSMSEAYKATFINNDNWNPEDYNDSTDAMPTTGAKNGLTLADLRGKSYDDPQWEQLLDQLTASDMETMIAYGGYSTTAIDSVGKVSTTDCDGPAAINNNFTRTSSIGFPGCTLISATWNRQMAHDFGCSIGQMADEMDVSGWYAPAMNIHRTAFSGRNFEYFSEDAVLSGKMAAQAVLGVEEFGVYAYIKHYALNDQEINRNSQICTWLTEQSMRENYLRAFELAVKEGKAKAVMSSFNYVGTGWAGSNHDLQTAVLRDEWGFRGMVLTDYYGVYAYMDADQAIRGGTDLCLAPMDNATNHLTDQTSATSIKAARQACRNIMYTVVNSRAYEPENLNPGMESWKIALIVVDVLLAAAFAAIELLPVRKGYRKRREA